MPSKQVRFLTDQYGRTRQFMMPRGGMDQLYRNLKLSPIGPTRMQARFNPGQALVKPYRGRMVVAMESKAMQRGLLHLGLRALPRLTPIGLTLLAFEVGYQLDWDNPFAIFQPAGNPGWDFAGTPGARLCCKIGDAQEASRWYDTSVGTCTIFPCTSVLQVPGSVGQNPIIINSPFRYQHIVVGPHFEVAPGVHRMHYHQYWIIDRGSHGPKPPLEIPWNTGQPAISMPVPVAAPQPPAIREIPAPYPSPQRVPKLKPYQQPALNIRIEPEYPPEAKPQPQMERHNRVPPKVGEREKKEKVPFNKALKVLAALYDKATELGDLIDAIYDALPKEARRGQNEKDMYHKMETIYRNMGSLNLGLAVENIIYNHYEDKAFGKFYSYGRRAPYGAQYPGGGAPRTYNLSQRT